MVDTYVNHWQCRLRNGFDRFTMFYLPLFYFELDLTSYE